MVSLGPDSRRAIHGPDATVLWAHPIFIGGSHIHNHVIPEDQSADRKTALGNHIDECHAPLSERDRWE